MSKESVSKKERLFRSVWNMHMEGTDWGNIRMGAVAEASGIPKGTIYEHFRSKDQLLAETIAWSLQQEAKEVYQRLTEASGFVAMVDVIFEWVASPQGRALFLMRFMEGGKLPEGLKRELCCYAEENRRGLDTAEMVTEALIRSGLLDGYLETKGSRMAGKTALYSALAPVVAYSLFPERYADVSWAEVKAYSRHIFEAAFQEYNRDPEK